VAYTVSRGGSLVIIGAGYTRTGTLSLKAALETLGVERCLHPLSMPADDTLVDRARSGSAELDWREDLGECNAVLGWLGARYYRELIDLWPNSRVLLSVRDPEDWYRSYASCVRSTREFAMAQSAISDALMALDWPAWQGVLDGSLEEREHALGRYRRHNDEVSRTVPSERLLVYRIEDGWEPLCDFLGVTVPDAPFPHLNDRSAFRSRFARRPHARRANGLLRGSEPHLSALAVGDGERSMSQAQVLDALGMTGDPFAQRIFASCGVEHRSLALLESAGAHNLQGRSGEAEDQLFERSVRAVESLGVDLDDVDTVISASLFSLGGPTLAHRLVDHFGMSPATDKYHVVGVGCASAVPLLRLMTQAVDGHPGGKGLVVAAESMSGLLSASKPGDARAKVVGSAIFGDGCAAAIIDGSGEAAGPAIVASTVHQVPGTLGAVRMELLDDNSHLHLALELPALSAAGLAQLVDEFLAPLGLTRYAIDHWLVHPGGRRIIESVQAALALADEDVRISHETLAAHGNVGTPSIFYVLDALARQRKPAAGDRGLMVTVGPGITVGLMLLVW